MSEPEAHYEVERRDRRDEWTPKMVTPDQVLTCADMAAAQAVVDEWLSRNPDDRDRVRIVRVTHAGRAPGEEEKHG